MKEPKAISTLFRRLVSTPAFRLDIEEVPVRDTGAANKSPFIWGVDLMLA